jgi:hypothetical protein
MGNNVLVLKKPIMIDGEEVKKINYNYVDLTGKNLEEVYKETIKSGHLLTASYELDPVIGARIFAEASSNAYMDIQRLGVADYSKSAGLTRGYLFEELDSNEEDEIPDVLILKKPVLIDNAEVKKIKYDFESLSGSSIEKVFNEATKSKHVVSSSYELDPIIGARMFAEAAGILYSDVQKLELYDYARAASCARDFFMSSLGGFQEENI